MAHGWYPCTDCCDPIVIDPGDPCAHCAPGTTPKKFQLRFLGGPLGDNACIECQSISPATYIMEQGTLLLPTVTCSWGVGLCNCTTNPAGRTNESEVYVSVYEESGLYYLQALIFINGTIFQPTPDTAIYRKSMGASKPDCGSFNQEILPFDSLDPNPQPECTGYSSLTAEVTAVQGLATSDDSHRCGHCQWNTHKNSYNITLSGSFTRERNCTTGCTNIIGQSISVTNFGAAQYDNCCHWRGSYVEAGCTWNFDLYLREDPLKWVLRVIPNPGPLGDVAFFKSANLGSLWNCGNTGPVLNYFSTSGHMDCEGWQNITANMS